MKEEVRWMDNKNAIEVTKLTDKKIVTKEVEFRDGRTYMRARVRKLHKQNEKATK